MREIIKEMRTDTGLRVDVDDTDILAALLIYKEVSKAYLHVSKNGSWDATSFKSEKNAGESFVFATRKIYPVTPVTLETFMSSRLASGQIRATFIEEVVDKM